MIELALLFMLLAMFFIGWKVGSTVQDEVVPARRYLQFGVALAVLAMTYVVLRSHTSMLWTIVLCVVCGIILLIARSVRWLPAAVAGVLCGFAFFAPIEIQVQAAVICLLA